MWHTEVCGYQGHVYTREVGPNDTTVYMDWVYDSIPWRGNEPDTAAIKVALESASSAESLFCPYCECYEDENGCGCDISDNEEKRK